MDWVSTPDQRFAKESLESLDKYMSAIDADVDKRDKASKLPKGDKQTLYYRWKSAYSEWLAYYKKVGEDGINSFSAENVKANVKGFRERADAMAKELASAGVDVTPPPVGPKQPDGMFPGFQPTLLGLVGGVVLTMVGGVLVVKYMRKDS